MPSSFDCRLIEAFNVGQGSQEAKDDDECNGCKEHYVK